MPLIARTLSIYALALVIAAAATLSATAGETVTLTHVHGLSYSPDGSRLMIPSHHGLAIFQAGQWSKAPGPAHDYMGFAASRDALYSSGHPASGSGLINPFGLIKSRDGGKTWRKLGLEGESDFHTLATSWGTNAVYVFNHAPNSRMSQPGIHFTTNDGVKWTRAASHGLAGDLKSLAVHPTDAAIVAAGTTDGLFLSRDAGARFERLLRGQPVLATTFSLDGQRLLFSGYDRSATLAQIALKAGASPAALPIPPLGEDAVAYIAQNPARPDELAIATFKRSVLLSNDGGRTWSRIAHHGATQR